MVLHGVIYYRTAVCCDGHVKCHKHAGTCAASWKFIAAGLCIRVWTISRFQQPLNSVLFISWASEDQGITTTLVPCRDEEQLKRK